MAGGTFHVCVLSLQWKSCFVMLELARKPIIGNMAWLAIGDARNRKRVSMHIIMAIRAGRPDIPERPFLLLIHVTRKARRGNMRALERKLRCLMLFEGI